MNNGHCQVQSVPEISDKLSPWSIITQRLRKVIHAAKRRMLFLPRHLTMDRDSERGSQNGNLQDGDLVRVRSKKEIDATLDGWNRLGGCAFMEEMQNYCDTERRIFKKVNQFLDERDYLMKKTKKIYLLEGVYCHGTKDFGPCDRSCFYFWREEWLEPIEDSEKKG